VAGALIGRAVRIQRRGTGVTDVAGVDSATDGGRILRFEGGEIRRYRVGRLRRIGERHGHDDCCGEAGHPNRHSMRMDRHHDSPPWTFSAYVGAHHDIRWIPA